MGMLKIGAAALLAMTGAANAQNLITNGSLETPGPGFILFQGWENYNNVFSDVSVEVPAFDGTTSAKMFGQFGGVQSDQVMLQTVTGISAGQPYTLSAQLWHNSSDAVAPGTLILLQMVFQDAGGNNIEANEIQALTPNVTPTDQWNEASLTAIAPAGTAQILVALLHLQLDGAAPGASFWDNIVLEEGEPQVSCPADLAPPFGVLNIFDIQAFLNLYNQGCP